MLDTYTTLALYSFVFLFSLYFLHISTTTKSKKYRIVFSVLSFLPLWFLNVFRAPYVGTDYINVGEAYSSVVNKNYHSVYNWFWFGLKIFCRIIGFIFSSNSFWFYLVLGSIFIIFLYKSINNCEYKVFSLFLFLVFCLYLQSFNQSRQIVALVIVLYSIKFLKEENFVKYFICILFAAIFHESSIIFIPLYFLKNIKINKKIVFCYLILMLLFYFNNNLIYNIISYSKYKIYFTTQYNISNVSSSYINLIIRMFFLIFCLAFYKRLNNDKKYNFCYHMIFICTILQILTIKFYFLGRITTYFYAFYIYILPKCINLFLEKFDKNGRKFILLLIIIMFVAYFLVYYFSSSGAVGSGYDHYGLYNMFYWK